MEKALAPSAAKRRPNARENFIVNNNKQRIIILMLLGISSAEEFTGFKGFFYVRTSLVLRRVLLPAFFPVLYALRPLVVD
jgi:hypothetical protein